VAILGFLIQWCGNQLISGYLALVLKGSGITDPETQNLINGGLQIFAFIVGCTSATFVERLGRRFLFLGSTTGMLTVFTIWTALAAQNQQKDNTDKGLSVGIVVMVFAFSFFYSTAMAPLPIAYLLEVLPYTLRAKGLSVFNLAQYSSGLLNGFVNPIGLAAVGWRYYIVFVVSLVLWLVVIYFTFPETRGLTLEEVSQIFDGAEALEGAYDIKADGLAEAGHTEEKVPVVSDRKGP
jgi:MFS family permease